MNTKPIEIDWLLKPKHFHLAEEDVCYYFMEYTSKGGWSAGEANQFIYNFKKDLSYKDTFSWPYKQMAIQQLAKIYANELDAIIDFSKSTLVPIPPSKCKANELHDDRMLRTLNGLKGADVRELIYLENDMPSSHSTNNRDIDDIMSYLSLDVGLCNKLGDNIYLFDDVLVTGAHFKACKNIILHQFPEKRIFGVFAARAIPEKISFDFSGFEDI